MSSHRNLLPALLLLITAPLATAAPPAAKPTPADIARWVRELADDDFSVREAASKKLWAAGEAAQAALERAAMSDDSEVVRRAKDILVKFRWGIYPDTPRKVVDLITEYRSAEMKSRAEIIGQLIDEGPVGCKSVARLAEMEQNVQARQALADKIAERLDQARSTLLTTESFGTLEPLLNVLLRLYVRSPATQPDTDVFRYISYWTLRGKLDERIAEIEPLATGKGEEVKRYAEVLAYLYRARGDRKAACRAAARTGNNKLIRDLLCEAADWKELARRPELLEGLKQAQQLATRATYLRLAGDDKALEAALKELSDYAAKRMENDTELFECAKGFYLNGRPDEAGPIVLRQKNLYLRHGGENRVVLFEVLCAQHRFKDAFALVDQVRDKPEEKNRLPALEILQARTLHVLGEKDRALEIFNRYGDQIKSSENAQEWSEQLLEAEQRLGLTELALEHGASALEKSKDQPSPVGSREQKPAYRLLKVLFPSQAAAAHDWWSLLYREKADTKPVDALKEVADILKGKADLKKLHERIDADKERDASEREGLLVAFAEAAVAARQREQAVLALKEADTEKSLLRLGDLLAEDREWTKAADTYLRAWEKGKKHEPLPLFLRGWALTKAGQETVGKTLMEQSHWLPQTDAARMAFREALRGHGHIEASRRENDLLLRLGRPASGPVSTAFRLAGFYPEARKAPLRAAMLQEQAMLHCLVPSIYFVQMGNFVRMPSFLCRLRARGYLEAGQRDLARREIARSQVLLPGDSGPAIDLVPLLERQGMKKEAAALYDEAHAQLEKLCRDYPRSSYLHNAAAWLSACCRRDLDRALEHARESVKLAPEAGNYDTLAEVYFQRGDRDRAVATQKKAIELNPKRAYFRKQLKRIEAGDPKAERPLENEE